MNAADLTQSIDETLRDVTASAPNAMTPVLHRVVGLRRETSDVITLVLEPESGPRMTYRPGQFNMLSVLGVGEAAISLSSAPGSLGPLRHSVRDVGSVTHALCQSSIDDLIGVRGPFGTDWQIPEGDPVDDSDVVIVAGGIGLAPLRGAIYELIRRSRQREFRVFVLIGARDPSQIAFAQDFDAWRRGGARVEVTVDRGSAEWDGRIGLVTTLITDAGFDPKRARALVCGPEIMMRFSARSLIDVGVDPERILVSLERNMQCGLGWCGHCQLGPFLLCRDGPVVPYAGLVSALMKEDER